ncbi:hypothetical protein D9611_013563 [Ephemerocybe angulata]|uniref:Uncharacterized protein n=1 Tax=Ephemerocybe angulata TaxID=980116 RepID=A0A8H5C3L1_9AGAR|nr:hypothetical protein D9611_013563 [Tulosesus angulatus]
MTDSARETSKRRRKPCSDSELEPSELPASNAPKRPKVLMNDNQGAEKDGSMPAGASEAVSTEVVAIEDLLDLSEVLDQKDLQARFDTIAKALLCDYHLVVTRPGATRRLQVMELEFYFQKADIHEDPFTHGSEEQKVAGRWYFHRAPRPSADANRSQTSTTAWRGGTRKGLDLTLGRSPGYTSSDGDTHETLLRGGILLRSVRVLGPNSKVISGPSLLVDEILASSGAKDIGDVVNGKWGGNVSAFPSQAVGEATPSHSLYLVPASLSAQSSGTLGGKSPTIYTSPRIGLDLSHPGTTGPSVRPLHSRLRFLGRAYRYFREPHLLTANGRSQTFLGIVYHSAQALIEAKQGKEASSSRVNSSAKSFTNTLSNPRILVNVCKITGLKEPTAHKYLEDFKAGRKGGEQVLKEFVGPSGKGAGSSPKKYLVMMGALSSLVLSDE